MDIDNLDLSGVDTTDPIIPAGTKALVNVIEELDWLSKNNAPMKTIKMTLAESVASSSFTKEGEPIMVGVGFPIEYMFWFGTTDGEGRTKHPNMQYSYEENNKREYTKYLEAFVGKGNVVRPKDILRKNQQVTVQFGVEDITDKEGNPTGQKKNVVKKFIAAKL